MKISILHEDRSSCNPSSGYWHGGWEFRKEQDKSAGKYVMLCISWSMTLRDAGYTTRIFTMGLKRYTTSSKKLLYPSHSTGQSIIQDLHAILDSRLDCSDLVGPPPHLSNKGFSSQVLDSNKKQEPPIFTLRPPINPGSENISDGSQGGSAPYDGCLPLYCHRCHHLYNLTSNPEPPQLHTETTGASNQRTTFAIHDTDLHKYLGCISSFDFAITTSLP